MRYFVSASVAAIAIATIALAGSTQSTLPNDAVKLAEGFYQIPAPKGVDEAYIVTPQVQKSANGTTMVSVASDNDEEETIVYGHRSHGGVFAAAAALLGR
jgi:hypothetical protein